MALSRDASPASALLRLLHHLVIGVCSRKPSLGLHLLFFLSAGQTPRVDLCATFDQGLDQNTTRTTAITRFTLAMPLDDPATSRSPVLFLDGGLGTSLQDNHGVVFDKSTPLWSSHLLVSDQATLLACQSDFGRVPVDIILTATYQASLEGFAKTRTDQHPSGIGRDQTVEYVRSAVQIAHKAGSDHGGKVALSIGPYGACMIPGQEYSGLYDEDHSTLDTLGAWHLERLKVFADAGAFASPVSYLAVETIPRMDEIIAIRKALDDSAALRNGIPYWVACLFPGEADTLPDGTSVQAAVFAMLDPKISRSTPWGIGINCTKIWKLERLIQLYELAVEEAIRIGWLSEPPALVLYPDGTNGEVYNTTTQTWELPSGEAARNITWDEQMANIVRQVQDRGRWKLVVVGGCCKASPVLVSKLRQRLEPGP